MLDRLSPNASIEWERYLCAHLPPNKRWYIAHEDLSRILFARHRPSLRDLLARVPFAESEGFKLAEVRRKCPKTVTEWMDWLQVHLPQVRTLPAAILMSGFVAGADFAYATFPLTSTRAVPYPEVGFAPNLGDPTLYCRASLELGAALISIEALSACALVPDLDTVATFELADDGFELPVSTHDLWLLAGAEEARHSLWWPLHSTGETPPRGQMSAAEYHSYDIEHDALGLQLALAHARRLPQPTLLGLQRLHDAANALRLECPLSVPS